MRRGFARNGFASLAVAIVSAAHAADAELGGKIAERWCAQCHVVSQTQQHANVDVPSFAAIGRDPALDENKLANFLKIPHPKMPDMSLTRAEIDNLVAYIRAQAN